MDLFEELNNLITKKGFFPNKKIAQNFVIDQNLLDKMVEAAELKKEDTILEVGAGTGFLTRELLKHSKVIAFEIDGTLYDFLKEEFVKEISQKKLILFKENFLNAEPLKFNKVVSLPPYTISSKMLFKLLEGEFQTGVLVFQREFVFKCLSQPGFKEFCPLAVLLNYYFDSKILIDKISPKTFFPVPKSFSSLILLSRKKNIARIKKEELFSLFLKTVFRYKNKNLSNALSKSFPFLKNDLKLKEKEFNESVSTLKQKGLKVYLVEPNEFVEIFEKLF